MMAIFSFFSRRTLLLFLSIVVLLAMGGVLFWKAQIDRKTIAITKTGQAFFSTKKVVTDLPLADLLNKQVLELRQGAPLFYSEQEQQTVDSYPQPALPVSLDIVNTGIGNSVLITWQAASYQSYDGIVIDRSIGIEQPKTAIAIATIPKLSGSYQDTTVKNGQTYYYRVRSYRKTESTSTYSVPSAVVTVIVGDTTPPSAPTNLTVTRDTQHPLTLTVKWRNPLESDVIANRIYRSQTAGMLGELVAEIDSTTFWQETLATAGTYYYTVTAVDSSANESSTKLAVSPAGNETPFVSSADQVQQLLHTVNP